jgi:hypothetical protein
MAETTPHAEGRRPFQSGATSSWTKPTNVPMLSGPDTTRRWSSFLLIGWEGGGAGSCTPGFRLPREVPALRRPRKKLGRGVLLGNRGGLLFQFYIRLMFDFLRAA